MPSGRGRGVVPNVRPTANVSGSMKIINIFVSVLFCVQVSVPQPGSQVCVPKPGNDNRNQTNVSIIYNVFNNYD